MKSYVGLFASFYTIFLCILILLFLHCNMCHFLRTDLRKVRNIFLCGIFCIIYYGRKKHHIFHYNGPYRNKSFPTNLTQKYQTGHHFSDDVYYKLTCSLIKTCFFCTIISKNFTCIL
jgi:hypothetical protein